MTSGPNRHFIPAFLQRGFAIPSKVSKSKKEIWYFGTNQRREKRLIKETGSEDFFYSDATDDIITNLESDLASKLTEICDNPLGRLVNAEAAAALVSHLSMRTAHFRDTARDVITSVLTESKSFLADPKNIATCIGLGVDEVVPTDRFREFVIDQLTRDLSIAELGIPPRVFERLVFFLLKENSENVWGPSPAHDAVRVAADELRAQSPKIIRSSHDKALSETVTPSEHENFLQTLDWGILAAPDSGAILPDCVIIAIDEDGKAGSYMFTGNDRLGAVVMAVSYKKLLVGRNAGFELPTEFEYNIEAARFSHSFFLSHRKDEETSRLHGILGEGLQVSLEENVAVSMDSWRGENISEPLQDVQGVCESSSKYAPTDPTRYQLCIRGCNNRDDIHSIQENISNLVAEFANVYSIEFLDGITIARDYVALMRSIAQNFSSAPTTEISLPEAGVGVGKTVLIAGMDVLKAHIYLPSTVAQALISDNPDKKGWAEHIFVKQLTSVFWMGKVDRVLPGDMTTPHIESQIDGWLYVNVHAAIKGYEMSRVAASIGNSQEIANGLRGLLVDSLDCMGTNVMKSRRAYRMHGDMDKLLTVVLPTIRNVLTIAANLLGHCSNTGDSPFDESGMLKSAIERRGLTTWFNWYQRHLERFSKRLGQWASFDEFLAFNIHVERLLLAIGMFPWEGPEGLRVEVPCKIPGYKPDALYLLWLWWIKGDVHDTGKIFSR